MIQRANILIIEDEAVLAMDLAEQLTAYGYCVVGIPRTGRNALSLLQTYPVDLILCDIGLAGDWDGIRTATELVRWRPFPVIYLTGHTDRALLIRAQAYATNCQRQLVKNILLTNRSQSEPILMWQTVDGAFDCKK